MKLTRTGSRAPLHLTYCTNVHPGQTLDDVTSSLRGPVADVKQRLAPNDRFGVGLRLSAEAVEELGREGALERFEQLLQEHDYYVFTLNGFPYGPFHGAAVKEHVYLPDWSSTERVDYTRGLASVLARLLPEGMRGSISTVPGAFKPLAQSVQRRQRIVEHLLLSVSQLVDVERRTGQHLTLALEPEPFCMFETTNETLSWFQDEVLAGHQLERFRQLSGCAAGDVEALLRRHLGVCLDTCHAAVEFESPLECYQRYQAAGVQVAKVQVSAGLRLDPRDSSQIQALRAFDESVYLHQVIERNSGGWTRWPDLHQAFEHRQRALVAGTFSATQWRVHFHVPIFSANCGPFQSTQDSLPALLEYLEGDDATPHLEVETYTWDVLPEHLRSLPLSEAIAAELCWARNHLSGT